VVVQDRHAAVGYHLVKDVYGDDEMSAMVQVLQPQGRPLDREEEFRVFLNMLAHHDQFGVLSTGEGSLALLCETVEWRRAQNAREAVRKQKRDLSLLLLLNLADIAVAMAGDLGSPTAGALSTFKVERVVADWKRVMRAIAQAEGSRAEFARLLLLQAQAPEVAIERVARLYLDACPPKEFLTTPPDRMSDDEKLRALARAEDSKRAEREAVEREAYQQMADVLKGDFLSFCTSQALLCKFDYFRKFIEALLRTLEDTGEDPKKRRHSIKLIVEILDTLVRSYRALTTGAGGAPQRVGVQMMGLTRTTEITDKILSVLVGGTTDQQALRWIAEEIGAWLFID